FPLCITYYIKSSFYRYSVATSLISSPSLSTLPLNVAISSSSIELNKGSIASSISGVSSETPEREDAIAPLFNSMDEEEIATLSGKVDNEGEEIKDVATEYLEDEDLLE